MKKLSDIMDHALPLDDVQGLHAAGLVGEGELVAIHKAGPHAVIEYRNPQYDAGGLPVFYAFHRGRDIEMLFESLDAALLYLVCLGRKAGPGTPVESWDEVAVIHKVFCRTLGLQPGLRPLSERKKDQ